MILRERHVIANGPDEQPLRMMVLWVGTDAIATLDLLCSTSIPAIISAEVVVRAIEVGTWVIETDPIEVSATVGRLPSNAEKDARNRFWNLIEPLVRDARIFDPVTRGRLISARSRETGVSRNTIKAKLDRYWRGGLRVAALIPAYVGRGPRGALPAAPGGPKRGRPAGLTGDPRSNVTAEVQKAFQRAVDAEIRMARGRFSLRNAYRRFTDVECVEAVEDPDTGQLSYVRLAEYEEFPEPSYAQFKWWYDREKRRHETGRRIKGDALWEKDNRITVGSSAAETWGPGSRFQIDATIMEIALLSRHRRGDIIGKPVLYVVIDVWSRLVVGFYVGVTNASWAGAAMALANCTAPKAELLRKYGYDPDKHWWEVHHMCAALLSDGGELKSHRGDVLVSEYNCTIETAAPYRGDWKGVVEKRFDLTNVRIGSYVPGMLDTTYRGRGAEDYRFSARLTLDDLTEILLGLFLEYNNTHELKGLDVDADVAAAGVPKIPAHLWRYGCDTRGEPRSYDHNGLRFAMMESAAASATPSGILFRGRTYSCPELLASGLLLETKRGRIAVRISWDDRIVGVVYWHDTTSPTGYRVCRLTTKSRYAAKDDRSFWEIDDADDRQRGEVRDRHHATLSDRAELTHRMDSVVKRAECAFADGQGRSDSERVAGLREARANERRDDAFVESPPLTDPSPLRSPPKFELVKPEPRTAYYSDMGVEDTEGDDDD